MVIENYLMVISKKDYFYFQIQEHLHITKKVCLFAVWLGEIQMVKVETFFRDDDFWDKNVIGKLVEIYMKHILPELIDPHQARNIELRQPMISKKTSSQRND